MFQQKNRQFYCYKFKSDRLRKFNYNINTNFQEAKNNEEIIALADNQILRTIRDIKEIKYSPTLVEELYGQRSEIQKLPNTKENIKKIKYIQYEINHLLFIPEYITVEIEKTKHYEYIYHQGFVVNGIHYYRLSCSATQARNSTVIFCSHDILEEIKKRLNNNRNLNIPIAPSKFNAYFGLYSSATKLVTEPNIAIVPDYENSVDFTCNYVTETEYDEDDTIELRNITQDICRTDGMGLISPQMAEQWAEDLHLNYTPCQFIVRQSFLKGLVTTFDFKLFCKEKNNNNYMIKTVYKDCNDNYIYKDIRECDLIISKSQFKLWDSYNTAEEYVDSYRANKLYWGVTQYSPREYNEMTNLNYQFIQALDLKEKDIHNICQPFLDWISGITLDNPYYALLFLTGQNNTENRIKEYLKSWEIYWIKCLIANSELFNDKFIQKKIYQYVTNIIKKGCLGQIPVKGNFQFLVTDPYAYMQHVCGLPITGLLNKNEYYSNYWNERNITELYSARSPLTYRSEPCYLKLVQNEELDKWYKYCNFGIIVNWFGYETVKWAGSDWDGDILFSSSNKTLIKAIYKNEFPIVYEPPKPQKIIPTEEDLFHYDIFGMGSQIGQITNKGASGYALLPLLEQKYGIDSEEYQITYSRLKQTCKAQSAQID